MKEKQTQMWIPLYVDKWIFGSTRIELEPAERGVFVDLMAFGAKDQGFIRANEITAYHHSQLAGLLNIPIELLQSTIIKCLHFDKLEETAPGIYRLKNWDKFQLSKSYISELENGSKPMPGVGLRTKSSQERTNGSTIREEKIVEEKREKEITTTETAKSVELVDNAKLVDWSKCNTELQSFMAYYIKEEMPAIYKSGTQAQVSGLFKRFGRPASELLSIAGSLPIAIRVFELSRAFYNKKGLSWNLSTVLANSGDFLNQALQEKINGNGK